MFGLGKSDWTYKRRMHVANNKDRVHKILQICSAIISLITIACIVCYHGFHISLAFKNVIRVVTYGSLFFYIFKYALFLCYSLHPKSICESRGSKGVLF